MNEREQSFPFRLGASLFWAIALGIVLKSLQEVPERTNDGLVVAALIAQFGALCIGINRPKIGFGAAAAIQLVSSAVGASPNLGIGVFALLGSRFYEEQDDVEKRTSLKLAVMLVIAVVVALPRLFDWDSGALGPTQEWHRVLASFAILYFAMLLRANFNLMYLDRAAAIEARDRAAATERARIARELHDVVAHQMTVVVAQAQGAEALVASDPDRARTALRTITDTTRNALVEMRRLVDVQRPAVPVDIDVHQPQPGLAYEDYARLAEGAEAAGLRDVAFRVDSSGQPDPSVGVALSAYRVIQEAITNAAKHSPGSTLEVDVQATESAIRVRVTNGPPTEPARDIPGAGVGLVGMQERVAVFGGTLETGPTADGGWSVVATFPTLEAPSTSE